MFSVLRDCRGQMVIFVSLFTKTNRTEQSICEEQLTWHFFSMSHIGLLNISQSVGLRHRVLSFIV